MSPLRVVVCGTGSMGAEVLRAVCAADDMEPVGVIEKFAGDDRIALPDGSGYVPLSPEPETLLAACRPDVLIDFTNAEWTEAVAPIAVAAGVRPVVGTTGLSPSFVDGLDAACSERGIGGVVSPNFALGAVLMMEMARLAARFLDHAEIIELHHDRKADAPSGTAMQTARAMIEARGAPFAHGSTERSTLPGARGAQHEGIAIHSVRLPGFVAHQEVIFGALGQTLSIRHDSTSRESFMPGVLMAARASMERVGLARGLEEIIGIAGPGGGSSARS